MTTKSILFGLCLLTVVGPVRAGAADKPTRRERARTFLVLRIADALSLSDEKALEVSKILRSSDDTRQQLRSDRSDLEAPLRSAVEAADEKALGDLVARANDIDRKLSLLPSESFLKIQEILSPVERGKLLLLLPQLRQQVRARRGGRPAPGRGASDDD